MVFRSTGILGCDVTTVVCSRWVHVLVLTEKADLDAAIAESLKETPGNILGGQISREEQEISRSVRTI